MSAATYLESFSVFIFTFRVLIAKMSPAICRMARYTYIIMTEKYEREDEES